jgi:multiple sugar transport system permease protein
MKSTEWAGQHRNLLVTVLRWVIVAIAGVFFLAPAVWMVGVAFKPASEFFTDPPTWFSSTPTLEHFQAIFGWDKGARSLVNSLIVASAGTFFAIVIGTPAAYALARLNKKGDSTSIWFLSQRLLPPVAVAIPIFLIIGQLGMINTLQGLALPYIAISIPYVVWMMRGYMMELPEAIEESAMVDGCSRFETFYRVVLPVVRPGLLSTAALVYIFIWSEFLLALFITRTPQSITAPVQVAFFKAATSTYYGQISALSLLAAIPLILIVIAIQRSLVRGLTLGAVKG